MVERRFDWFCVFRPNWTQCPEVYPLDRLVSLSMPIARLGVLYKATVYLLVLIARINFATSWPSCSADVA